MEPLDSDYKHLILVVHYHRTIPGHPDSSRIVRHRLYFAHQSMRFGKLHFHKDDSNDLYLYYVVDVLPNYARR